MVPSFWKMMKEEGLVDVSWLVHFLAGGTLGGSGQRPVGDRHAVIGESRRSDIDAVGMDGGCGRVALVLLVVLWIGIIGVINGGSGPVGRWRWLLWVPVALDAFTAILVGGAIDRVENALESLGFENGGDAIVERHSPKIGTGGHVLPFQRGVVSRSLLIEVSGNDHGSVGTGGLLQQSSDFHATKFGIKGIQMGSNNPALAGFVVRLDQQTECGTIARQYNFFGPQDLFASGHHGGSISVASNLGKVVSPQSQDFLQEGLRVLNGLLLMMIVVVVWIVVFHFSPMNLVQDENIRVRLADGSDDSCCNGVHVAFVLG